MNDSLQRWREDFDREPDAAFDRLVSGLVPLGATSQLSFGEILDKLFEPGDAALDEAAVNWLGKRILGIVPEDMTLRRWISVLEEYFRGIAAMELPKTSELLRHQHKRIRLWLHGFYAGMDRDPEGAYLLALVRAQVDQRFSPLWLRLILGEELPGRAYLGIGILGFRKMPEQSGHEASDVPDGLLRALLKLADKPGTNKAKWEQTMRGLFASYRRNEPYWVASLAPLLPHYIEPSKARDWLSELLPAIPEWRPADTTTETLPRRIQPVSRSARESFVARIAKDMTLCDTPEFTDFLNQYRSYARTTGDLQYIDKTFNNLSTTIVNADSERAALAVSLMEEAIEWVPSNPHNWTSYAKALSAAHRETEAINVLWEARQRFAFNPFIRSELGRLLRESGDLTAAEGVYREAVSHFPSDVVCRSSLADLLIDRAELDEAKRIFQEVMEIDSHDQFAKVGLARILSIYSARTHNEELRDEASQPQDRQTQQARTIAEMSVAERLGRAMIALWQAERAGNASLRSSLCADANALLEVPEDKIDDDLLAALVETRGLVLLASGDAQAALTYFEAQIRHYGRGAWIGVRIGEGRARTLLGMSEETKDNAELLNSSSARFALHVAQVIQVLSSSTQDTAVLVLLKALYPKAAEFAAHIKQDDQGELSIHSGVEMLGAFLQTRWFRPAGIQSTADFDNPEALHAVVEHINSTRTDTFDVISNATLALAA
jgi:tetratricopeptide (TPR) repeat protein